MQNLQPFTCLGEPTEEAEEIPKEDQDSLPKKEEKDQEEEADITKRSTQEKKFHYDYEREDLGTEDKGVERYERRHEQVALKKPSLPFYCSIPLVSFQPVIIISLVSCQLSVRPCSFIGKL